MGKRDRNSNPEEGSASPKKAKKDAKKSKQSVTEASPELKTPKVKKSKLKTENGDEPTIKAKKQKIPAETSPKAKIKKSKLETEPTGTNGTPKEHKKRRRNRKKESTGDNPSVPKKLSHGKIQRLKKLKRAMEGKSVLDLNIEPDILEIHNKRKHKRDLQTLFVSKTEATKDDLRAKLPGIMDIRKVGKNLFVMFNNREAAKCAYKLIKEEKVFGDKDIVVDFIGRTKPPKTDEPFLVDSKSLFVNDLPGDMTGEDVRTQLQAMFPKAQNISTRKKFNFSLANFALLNFETPEDAREAFLGSDKAMINGTNVAVLYSIMKPMRDLPEDALPKRKAKKSKNKKRNKNKASKATPVPSGEGEPEAKPKVLLAKKKDKKVKFSEGDDAPGSFEKKKKTPTVLLAKKKKKVME